MAGMKVKKTRPIFFVLSALCICLAGCGCKKVNYPDAAFNVDRAVRMLHGQYGSCFPADYNASRYLTDLDKDGFDKDGMKVLKSTDIEVWTDEDCAGYVLTVRDRCTNKLLLWDRSATRSTLDGPTVDNTPPPQPPERKPAACSCSVGAPAQ